MKIYNEVITQFNDLTGQWETLYEDSVEYNGPMALAQGGLPPNASAINTSDTIADTRKTTAGYFTGGDGTLDGHSVFTASLGEKPGKYFYNINHKDPATDKSSATQFAVTYGHYAGSGSDTYGDSTNNPNTLNGETEAIYNQLAHTLMHETEASGGFYMRADGNKDDYIYAIVGRRERFKDRLNKKAWTLALSGSDAGGTFSTKNFTDDSKSVPAVATPGGPRHNICEGQLGVCTHPASTTNYGWFYPESGMMVFSGYQLGVAFPGHTDGQDKSGSLNADVALWAANDQKTAGFIPNENAHGNSKNGLRLANCMRMMGAATSLRLRSEEDQTQENYFCRIRAEQYNFSANHSFVSGSKNKLINTDMFGDPQTFITGVGLYNSSGQLLAIAKLSKPLLKNFAAEATIKVKLTY